MSNQWRLICPNCDRRTFHREEHGNNGEQIVECIACGSSDPLAKRKQESRRKDPNPDRDEPVGDESANDELAVTDSDDADLSRWSR